MNCPKCGLINSEGSVRCDCGYQFLGRDANEPPTPNFMFGHQLATRRDRFWASFLDGTIIFVPLSLIKYAKTIVGWKNNSVALNRSIDPTSFSAEYLGLSFFFLAVVLTVILYDFHLLSTKGQTIGKAWRNIKIVRMVNGENGGFLTNVLVRWLLSCLLYLVPFFIFADISLIFLKSRRCIHDYIAGTVVVKTGLKY